MESHLPYNTFFGYVRSLCVAFPRLQLLADFMSDDVSILDFHYPDDTKRRMEKVDVTIVDLGKPSHSTKRFTDSSILENYLESRQEPAGARIIFVEDLSRDVIEILGSKFRLDPSFFENHIRGIQRFLARQWTGDKTLRLDCSLATVLDRNFCTISYCRPYRFDGGEHLMSLRQKLNVPRIGSIVHNLYLRERTSVCAPPLDGDRSVFIVLCDPLLDHRLPNNIHLRSSGRLPLYNEPSDLLYLTSAKQKSTKGMLIDFLLSLDCKGCEDMKVLIVERVIAISLDFCAAALCELNMSKHRMDSKYITRPKYSHITILKTIYESGGWMGLHEYILFFLRESEAVYLEYLPQGEGRTRLQQELQCLEKQHQSISRRVQGTIDFVRQEHEAAVTRDLERLTKISFIFVPITSVATVFSISEPLRFALLFAIAIPLLGICLYVINFERRSMSLVTKFVRFLLDPSQWVGLFWSYTSRRKPEPPSNPRAEEPNIGSFEGKSEAYEKFTAMKAAYAEEKMASLIAQSKTSPMLRRRAGWPSL